ncbi:MAG: PDZ domain-containing protein [Proteobacteria bacterium]|nr:PDZ domain-containing protein [Pseudomonadota bacterium]
MRRVGPAAIAAAFVFSSFTLTAHSAHAQQQNAALGLTVKPVAGGTERAQIVSVAPGSMAERAGLKAGDVLLYAASADGERTSFATQDALERWTAAQQPDSSQALTYLRGQEILTANVRLGGQAAATPGAPSQAAAEVETASARLLGLTVKAGADGNSVEIITLKPGSAAAAAGLQVGDILFSGQTGTANADSLISQEALDAFATKSAGQTRDLIYTRNKQFLTAKVAVPNVQPQTAQAMSQTPAGAPIGLGITVKEDVFALALTAVGRITAIVPGGDADLAGLKVGDSIREVRYADVEYGSIAGQMVADSLAYSTPPGTIAQFSIRRDGQDMVIPVKMTGPVATTAFVGMEVRDTVQQGEAEVTAVQAGSPAEAAGLQQGDHILGFGAMNDRKFLGVRGLHSLIVQYRGDWLTVNYTRNGEKKVSKLTIPKEPAYAAAQVLTASAGQSTAGQTSGGQKQNVENYGALGAAIAGVAAAPAGTQAAVQNTGGDPFGQTVTTLNGRSTQLPPFKLRAGQILEAQVSANGAPLMPKLCFEEDDVFNVDPQRCYENINQSGQSVVRFRHVAVEPEIVTLSVASTDASAGTYTITTRNGNRGPEGAAALAVLEGLAGKPYIIDTVDQGLAVKAAVNYIIDEPGKRGRLRYQIESGNVADFTYALDNNGQLTWASPTNSGVVYLGIDGLLYQQAGDTVGVRGRSPNGEFLNVTERRLMRGDNAEQMHIGVFGRSQRLAAGQPVTDDQVTTMMLDGPAHIAQAQQQRADDWAALGQLAGRFFYFVQGQYEYVATFQWEAPGEVLLAKFWGADEIGTTPNPLRRMVYNPATRTIATEVTHTNGAKVQTTFKRGPNGESIEAQPDGSTWMLSGAGNEWTSLFTAANKQQTKISYRPVDDNMLKIFADRTQAKQARLAQERAEAAARQAEEDSGPSLFDVLNFANTIQGAMSSPQAYIAAVSQAAPELAPILNGVAAAQSGGNPVAAGLGLGGGNPLGAIPGGVNPYTGLGGGGVGGLGGGPTGVRGSYPTRPNLAEGPQCPGFTVGNYRTHAFEGGANKQLYTHCGLAFEYYTMYLRAIEQGYSEADANRTYNAHEGAVRVLNSM